MPIIGPPAPPPLTESVYLINGQPLPFPATGQWMPRTVLGKDGNNNNIYAPTRAFQINWGNLNDQEWFFVYGYWQAVGSVGTVSVTIPALIPSVHGISDFRWVNFPASLTIGSADYADAFFEGFATYTGCVLDEPTVGPYEQRTLSNVTQMIRNIVT